MKSTTSRSIAIKKLMQGMQQRLHLAKQQSMQFTHPPAISVTRTIINSTKAKTRMVAQAIT